MRRYREMSSMGGGMNFYGSFPASYDITVNLENPLVSKILEAKNASVKPQAEVTPADPEILKAGEAKDATDEQKKAAEDAVKAGRLLTFPLPEAGARRYLYVACRRGAPMSGQTQQFVSFVKNFYQREPAV